MTSKASYCFDRMLVAPRSANSPLARLIFSAVYMLGNAENMTAKQNWLLSGASMTSRRVPYGTGKLPRLFVSGVRGAKTEGVWGQEQWLR